MLCIRVKIDDRRFSPALFRFTDDPDKIQFELGFYPAYNTINDVSEEQLYKIFDKLRVGDSAGETFAFRAYLPKMSFSRRNRIDTRYKSLNNDIVDGSYYDAFAVLSASDCMAAATVSIGVVPVPFSDISFEFLTHQRFGPNTL